MKGGGTVVPSAALESELQRQGARIIAGVDEVGRGAWAGPLVAGAAVFATSQRVLNLRDSKLLSREERDQLARRLKRRVLAWSVGIVELEELNEIGLGSALALCFQRALAALSVRPDYVLVDGKTKIAGVEHPQRAIIGGDRTVRCIAAASVLAKVERDRMMRTAHRTDPTFRRYRFDLNKGYPSPWHQAQLAAHGPSPFHRTCFAPIRAAQLAALRVNPVD